MKRCEHKKPFFPRVEVVWLDARLSTEWGDIDSHSEPLVVVHSVGHLVESNKELVRVAQSYTHGNHFDAVLTIPRSGVIRVVRL